MSSPWTLGLLCGLLLASACLAQVQPLTFIHDVPLQDQPEVHMANATMISPQLAIVCAHSVHYGKFPKGELRIGYSQARVIYLTGEMALLWSLNPIDVVPAEVPKFGPGEAIHVDDGEPVVHRYYNYATFESTHRMVTWDNSSYVKEGFEPGMSGSGLYKLTGEFIGLVEWNNGFVWNLPALRGFLEEAQDHIRANEKGP